MWTVPTCANHFFFYCISMEDFKTSYTKTRRHGFSEWLAVHWAPPILGVATFEASHSALLLCSKQPGKFWNIFQPQVFRGTFCWTTLTTHNSSHPDRPDPSPWKGSLQCVVPTRGHFASSPHLPRSDPQPPQPASGVVDSPGVPAPASPNVVALPSKQHSRKPPVQAQDVAWQRQSKADKLMKLFNERLLKNVLNLKLSFMFWRLSLFWPEWSLASGHLLLGLQAHKLSSRQVISVSGSQIIFTQKFHFKTREQTRSKFHTLKGPCWKPFKNFD